MNTYDTVYNLIYPKPDPKLTLTIKVNLMLSNTGFALKTHSDSLIYSATH